MFQRIGSGIERLYFFLAVSLLSGGYVGIPVRLADNAMELGSQNVYATASNAIILVGLIVIYALRWRQILPVASHGALLNVFILIAIASSFSSFSSAVSFRRSGTLIINMAFVYYAVACFPMHDIIRRISRAIFVAAIASTVLALGVPDIGVMSGSEHLNGAWNGVYRHKNELGWLMILGAITSGWLLFHERRGRTWHLLALTLTLFVAIMSRSRASQIAIVIMPVIFYGIRVFRLPGLARLWMLYALTVAVIATATFSTVYFAEIMGALGKDASLTGRSFLWSGLISLVDRYPLLGYGYGAFFLPGNLDMEGVMRFINWRTDEAHNDLINLILELGVPGALVAITIPLDAARLSLRQNARQQTPWAGLAAVFAIICILINCVEAILFSPGLFTVMLTVFYVALRLQEKLYRETQTENCPGARSIEPATYGPLDLRSAPITSSDSSPCAR